MTMKNSNVSYTGLVQKYIGSAYDNVKFVADNMDAVIEVSEITDLNGIVDQVAEDAKTASDAAAAALISETNAKTSEINSAASEASASHSEDLAMLSAAAALDSEKNAKDSENNAGSSAGLASVKADEAAASALESETSKDFSQKWSSEAEDVSVDDGVNSGFSAYHWAQKAEDASAAGESNTASNQGTGEGVFLGKSLVDLQFKSIKGIGAINITSDADSISIETSVSDDHSVLTNRNLADAHDIPSITNLQTELDAKAPLISPNFINTPTAPTPTIGDNSTRIATTEFLQQNITTKANIEYVDNQFAVAIALS